MKSNRATIRYMQEKLKSWILDDRVFVVVLVIIVAVGAFILGRLSVTEFNLGTSGGAAVGMTYTAPSPAAAPAEVQEAATSTPIVVVPMVGGGVEVVASKSGTKYHLPNCPGAKQIKPENLIRFSSRAAAEAAGYTPAANCKGL